MSDVSVMELEREAVEALPARELMTGCGCGCGNNTYQIGLVNIDDTTIYVGYPGAMA